MNSFLIRVLVNAVGLFVATRLPIGVVIGEGNYWVTLLFVAFIFGVVNAAVKPILALLTCPLYIVTLGLFTFVVNALMLLLTSSIARAVGLSFSVDGFWSAFVGALVISAVSYLLSLALPDA